MSLSRIFRDLDLGESVDLAGIMRTSRKNGIDPSRWLHGARRRRGTGNKVGKTVDVIVFETKGQYDGKKFPRPVIRKYNRFPIKI